MEGLILSDVKIPPMDMGDLNTLVGCVKIIKSILFLLPFFGLFFWCRSVRNEDNRRSEALISSIHEEMKDFHGRLCDIEERTKK